ncbi:MAG TPA: 5'-3' exonuclease H3TH domain-containing protein [Steroidobacteraceae bacterium]|nr:exodeoxyribonuclease IX [Gammaproteobacteria bacterium]HEV2286589.1 5'-3' exonuclease H3TH domain-containing protein [Steroidobacteraceae bacterium]
MIFLVDASVYVFRAYHSMLPDMRDRDGNSTHAVFGFARFLGDLIERVRPTHMAVAFDQRSKESYRRRLFPAYKANRERPPEDLTQQFGRCRELCRHLGVAEFVYPEYEADDIIGTLAGMMRASGERSAYITRDKDLAQLMRDGDVLWDFGARGQFGYHDIERHYGVRPERFADYLALAGDESDNIPGVPGVGHRTAASLMKAFASLDDLYEDLDGVAELKIRGAGTLGARLAEHRESVFLARRLTRISCDLPLGVGAAGLARRKPDLPGLGRFYDVLGFGPFLRQQGARLAQLPAA